MSELHPVTKLLLARMESHPEEFADLYNPRWSAILGEFENEAMEEDHKVFRTALSRIRMDKLHEKVMDELLNGEERRAEKERLEQQNAHRYAQISAVQAQTQAQAQQLAGVSGTAIQHPADHWGNVANIPRPSLFGNILGKVIK